MIKLLFLSMVGSILGLLLMLLRRKSGGRLQSAFFYWAWLIVLLRFALPAPGLIPVVKAESRPEYTVRENYAPRQDWDIPDTALPLENIVIQETVTAPMEPVQNAKPDIDFKALLNWKTVWLGVAALVILKQSIGYLLFSKKLRKTLEPVNDFELQQYIRIKQRFKPEIAKSRAVSTPMLLGLRKPLLVLPKREYSWETLNNILLHEFTHYRRGDVFLKWAAMLIFAFHWFNPLTRLFVKELDKVCELSCDERLLKDMDSRQKRSYGETLLELAGGNSLKSGTPATCLAMEKHVLKERLEQIMKYKNKGRLGMAVMLLCLFILGGCAAAVGPDTTPEPVDLPDTPPVVNDVQGAKVYTVDEFLNAIEPGASIVLAEGTFNLAEAKNYGVDAEHYSWNSIGDGYELQINKVDGLKITGAGMGKTNIVTEPRGANVLLFEGSENISLAGFTAGHTEGEKSVCTGGVLKLDGVRNADIDSCELFGCGTIGIDVQNSKNILARNCLIRDCNLKAVYVFASHNVNVDNCEIYNCGEDGYSLLDTYNSEGVVISNSRIHDNNTNILVLSNYCKEMSLLGNEFKDNYAEQAIFAIAPYDVMVEGCSFEGNLLGTLGTWFTDKDQHMSYSQVDSVGKAVDAEGNVLNVEALESMELKRTDFSFQVETEAAAPAETAEVTVKTVDELLAAIAPNTKIILDGELFDLSTASDFGAGVGEWYYWKNVGDGPELIISGVENLSIVGAGKDKTTIAAIPRYAYVLRFENCRGISLAGFTAGHTEEPGVCSGGVLGFGLSESISIDDCGLFGCGTIGIDALNCRGINVTNTEIYDCTSSGFSLNSCREVVFENCDIHDMPSFAATINGQGDCSYNGETLPEGYYYPGEKGELVPAHPDNTRPVNAVVLPEQPAPTPELGDFRIWFGESPIVTDCTMRAGQTMAEEPIRFFAGRNTVDVTEEAVTWTVSNPDAIELDPDEGLGYFCGVEVVNAVAGGVQLTATRGTESATITIYCLP